MASLGFEATVRPADIDETARDGEGALDLVERLAREKVTALPVADDEIVLGADTVVIADDTILGKPVDDADARRMLQALSGGEHRVATGMAAKSTDGIVSIVDETSVRFRDLSDADIDWYLSRGEHLDKAGAYGIQGAASVFVESISGSYDTVVGLNRARLGELHPDLRPGVSS